MAQRRQEFDSGGPTIRATIRSDFSAARDVQRAIMDRVKGARYAPQSVFAIQLALEESLINAIKHGNKLDPGKNVQIQATVTTEQTEIIVEDEGPGFDRCSVPDPTAEENLDKCSGRGILLMEAYMDSVEYSNRGRRVRMIKRNNGDAARPGCGCDA